MTAPYPPAAPHGGAAPVAPTLGATPERSAELAAAHHRAQERVAALAARTDPALRPPEREVRLLPVTKFFPAADVAALFDAGVRAVGENRDQEASAKAAELAEATGGALEWHCIGQVQTNKAKSVARWATSVHSVDRSSLIAALSRGYARATARFEEGEAPAPAARSHGGIECLIQVGLDRTPGEGSSGAARGGADPAELEALADAVAEAPGLRLAGLMGVAPLGEEPGPAFERLQELSLRLQESHPQAWAISAGMSGDLEEAIRWGSTLVRVGSAIMGPRPPMAGGAGAGSSAPS